MINEPANEPWHIAALDQMFGVSSWNADRVQFERQLLNYLDRSGMALVRNDPDPTPQQARTYLLSMGCEERRIDGLETQFFLFGREKSGYDGDILFRIDPQDIERWIKDICDRVAVIEHRSVAEVRSEMRNTGIEGSPGRGPV